MLSRVPHGVNLGHTRPLHSFAGEGGLSYSRHTATSAMEYNPPDRCMGDQGVEDQAGVRPAESL